MAREKEDYRSILEDILQFFDGKRVLTVTDVARFTGRDRGTVRRRFDIRDGEITAHRLARLLADL